MPHTILLLAANPDDTGKALLDEEVRKIDAVLQQGAQRNRFELRPHLAVRYGDVQELLLRYKPAIVHFCGQGDEQGAILLKDDAVQPRPLAPEQLASLFAILHDNLHCVVLNGCYTEHQALGIAQSVSFVTGLRRNNQDPATVEFAAGFYLGLGYGRNIQVAFELGCNRSGAVQGQIIQSPTSTPTNPTFPQLIALRTDPAQVLLAAPPLSQLHSSYLRSLFSDRWKNVSLAAITADDQRNVTLLDVYTPLPVDHEVVFDRNDSGHLADWRLRRHGDPEPADAQTGEYPGQDHALRRQQRQWNNLQLDEATLAPLAAALAAEKTTRNRNDRNVAVLFAEHAAGLQPHCVVLGAPGSGKSSFLRHLMLCMAGELLALAGEQGAPANASLRSLISWPADALTPLYVELRDLVGKEAVAFAPPADPDDEDAEGAVPTIEALWHYVSDHVLGSGIKGFVDELRSRFEHGQVLLLLDGLDEVPDAIEPWRRRQIQAFVHDLVKGAPMSRIVVTSRPYAYLTAQWSLDGFGFTHLRSLDSTHLVYLAQKLFVASDVTDAAKNAAALVQSLEADGRIEEDLYANPLLFTLFAALWQQPQTRGRLPVSEAELYFEAVQLLLHRWVRHRLPEQTMAEQWGGLRLKKHLPSVLETLACTVHDVPAYDQASFPAGLLEDILTNARLNRFLRINSIPDFLAQHAGILVASETQRTLQFVHRSFREYLAACVLVCRQHDGRRPAIASEERFPQGLLTRVRNDPGRWRNVFRLAAGELVRQDVQDKLWEELLRPLWEAYLRDRIAPAAALLALEAAGRHGLFDQVPDVYAGLSGIYRLGQDTALQALTDVANFPDPAQRNIAGELLGQAPGGDPRPGVGLRKDQNRRLSAGDLPDIAWVKVPATDGQGRKAFFYQDGTHKGLPDFWIARYPVTYRQFQAFVAAPDGYRNPHWWDGLAQDRSDRRATAGEQRFKFWNHPRERVNWYEAMAFCRWLTACVRAAPGLLPAGIDRTGTWCITLPTEWQWEKAARGFAGRRYPWGPEYQIGYANIDETTLKVGSYYLQKSTAVGMYPHGATPGATDEERIADLSGNVWEWCLNEYENPDNTLAGGSRPRVLRGGSWYNYPARAAASFRNRASPDHDDNNGFRVVVSSSP